ncbi:MAG: Cro/Cl family transcriptional regulator [Alteromonadaceae bacterium]|uniref:transcriptional regulator n=1 Tax=Paraglaciecola chathamensis TaxID=368405 RepID=UPI000C53D765|nr:transcriptional regulator [Paraglaciecola agarilytica]MBN26393.1 Cro/Cl family transcriptional regulator [Alteromonadaceae bacterium]|tara:strand:- start:83860 stop:84135 length:276 start_codon:yes stop_codon:yes gene_type:complete
MQVTITDTKQIGQIAKLVRKHQGLDQATSASLSGNGTTFTSEFENGKPTVEIGRVLNVLDALGITVTLDIPVQTEMLTAMERNQIELIITG